MEDMYKAIGLSEHHLAVIAEGVEFGLPKK
jgi:hypothetical protein